MDANYGDPEQLYDYEDIDQDIPTTLFMAMTGGLKNNNGPYPDPNQIIAELGLSEILRSPDYTASFVEDSYSMDTDTHQQTGVAEPVAMHNTQIFNAPSNTGMVQPPAPAHAAGFIDGGVNAEPAVSSMDSALEDIEPMRLGSTETRQMLQDRDLVQERFGSLDLNPSRNASAQQGMELSGGSDVSNQRNRQPIPVAPAAGQSRCTTEEPRSSPDSTSAKGFMENYRLPEDHHFQVTVKFMSTTMLEESVIEPNGCLLHYQRQSHTNAMPSYDSARKRIPISTSVKRRREDGTDVTEEFPWIKDKQKRYTELILQSFEGGVQLSSREGNIYAKRKSNTKLFWASTQLDKGHAQELKREQETEVFNWVKFEQKLASDYSSGRQRNLLLPAVWFSFAQQWDTKSCPITTKLVWTRVDPIKACEMVRAINPNVESTSNRESLHTSNFHISN